MAVGDFTITFSDGSSASPQYDPFTKEIVTGTKNSGIVKEALPAFTLSTDVKFNALADGADALPGAGGTLTAAGALQGAGGTITAVKDGDKTYIKQVYTGNWNGVDINDSYFNFQAGDRIKVVVSLSALTWGGSAPNYYIINVLLQTDHSGWRPIGATVDIGTDGGGATAVTAGDITAALNKDITFERTLSAADVAAIKSASPKAIRIRVANVTDAGCTIVYKEISVTGGDRK